MEHNFAPDDFARLFGLPAAQLPGTCGRLAEAHDFSHEPADAKTREEIVLRVLKHIDSDQPTKVGEHRADIWESCWSESLQRFIAGGHDLERLVPKFIKPGQPVRLEQNYVFPANPRFELDFFQVCRAFLFD